MAFQIPKRKTPARVSLAGALDYVLRNSINPSSEAVEIGPLLHQAHIRLMQFAMTPPHMRDAIMQPLPQFTLDPVHVAGAILDGIASGVLSVEGLPPERLDTWRARPVGVDWQTGVVMFPRDPRAFMPTLALGEVDALFKGSEPAAVEAAIPEKVETNQAGETSKLRNRTGPAPDKMTRVMQEMRSVESAKLAKMKLAEMVAQFKAGQTTVRDARIRVLSESAEQELRITPNNEK